MSGVMGHFGSRPKCPSPFEASPQFVPAMARVEHSVAMALVEEQKVARWTKEMGIETEADLAYWFDSQEQATCEAGAAWLQARARVAAGVGGLVRDLYAIRVIDEAAPRERPASAVMPRAVVNAASSGACAQLVVSNARHRDLLMRILATSSRYSLTSGAR